jgi:hypothetical protein
VPTFIQGVSEVVTGELDAFVAGDDSGRLPLGEPGRLRRWRGPSSALATPRRPGRRPPGDVEVAAAREPDRRVRARLETLAAQMRERAPAPPEGFDPETHPLLLDHLDPIERWALEDTEGRFPP